MLTAKQLKEIKTRVNKEMSRRSYYGDLSKFNTQFQTTPNAGGLILAEQGNKVVEGLLNIEDIGNLNIEDLKKDGNIPSSFDYTTISNALDKYEKESISGNKTSCRGACSGLCLGRCSTTCNGCQGSCGSTCEGSCTRSCGSSCGGCSSSCSGGCYSGCSTGCKNGCTGSSY
ncbi:MAG: hypothetical protein MSA56_04230 [Clostridium sp.]|nr:hypothetical protein [Clostridium sp.]